jgi:hypothetical protein
MTQPTPTCSECGATTPQEAKARCIRTTAKDACHGCELWPDEIAFDAPNPLTVEGVQRLADHLATVEPMTEPPLIDTLALIAKVHCWPQSAVVIAHALAEEILRHWQPPQALKAPEPAIELLKRALDRLPCDSDSDNALINEIWYFLRKFPPCEECGAMTAKESETRCHGSGDKDTCHGCDLWPDDDSISMQPAAQPAPATEEAAFAMGQTGASPSESEPVDLTDEELLRTYGLAKRDHIYDGPDDDWPNRAERAATICGLRAVLARCGHSVELVTPPPPSTEKLFREIDQLLDGIDRRVDHPEGGWWETDDGGRFGKIMLRKIKETISRHLRP